MVAFRALGVLIVISQNNFHTGLIILKLHYFGKSQIMCDGHKTGRGQINPIRENSNSSVAEKVGSKNSSV